MRNNIVKRTTRLAAALVAAFFFAGAAADPIVAVGSAPMDAGVAAARELAIQDALHQAALTQGAVVESAQVMDSGQVSESASLSADAVSGRVQVIDEHEQDGMYQVRIRFDPQAPGVPGARCAAPAGRHLLRRVSTAYFIVDHPADASDLESVGSRLPHEFASRMNARHGDALSVRDAGNVTIMPDPYQTDPHLAADNARKLALSEDAQFVVAGRLVSTQITDRSVRPSLFHSDEQTQQGMYYQGPLYQLIGGALEYRAVKRQFDFELWVFDGLTGALLANQRYAIEAEGNVLPREAPQFASAAFWKTDYGEPVSTLLNQAADRVAATIDCLPFASRVVRAEKDGQVYLDAGLMDGLQVGDKLLVYRARSAGALTAPNGTDVIGQPEMIVGDVSVIQVQPRLAIGIAQNGREVREGDIVRYITHH